MTKAFPLQWPQGWPRTAARDRKSAKFHKRDHSGRSAYKKALTVSDAVGRVFDEIRLMGADAETLVISTNIEPRLDGLPKSNRGEPYDPGVAVYWLKNGKPHVLPRDIYDTVSGNLAAIAYVLECLRGAERHGGFDVGDRIYSGFLQIEHQQDAVWWQVLGVGGDCTLDEAKAAYRRKASQYHPDKKNGDKAMMAKLNRAYEQAEKAHAHQS